MKNFKCLFILLMVICVVESNAQEAKLVRKAIEIQKEQTFNLTTTSSRTYLPVTIPENTVAWYIAFTSSTDENAANPIGLLSQIASKLDASGLTSLATSTLTAPNGTSACNVEICDLANRRKFMNMDDDYTHYDNISRRNLTNGVIKIETPYIGDLQVLLYNPSFTTSINVTIEVTAIIEDEETDLTVWSKEMEIPRIQYHPFRPKQGH